MTLETQLNALYRAFAYQKNQPHTVNYFGGGSLIGDSTSVYGRLVEYTQRVILGYAAEFAVQQSGGDILEIGCAQGWTTCSFAEIAKKYGVKVYCIDPYDGGQEGTSEVYNEFLKTCALYPDVITLLRMSSASQDAKDFVKDKKFSFAYVDGLHTKDAAYADIVLSLSSLLQNGILCVDDTDNLRPRDAGAAFLEAENNNLITKISLDADAERVLFTHKSWHFAHKKVS